VCVCVHCDRLEEGQMVKVDVCKMGRWCVCLMMSAGLV
jgi:hypothetical protein